MISICQLPSARARLRHGELLAGVQGRRGSEVLLVDRIEIAALRVDRETRHRLAAMHLGEQLAAGRDTQGLGGFRTQELRRQPGIVGRRYPGVEACGGVTRPSADVGFEGPDEAIAPVSAGIDRSEQQQDRQDGAQPPRITGSEPGLRQPDPQSARRCFHAPPVCFPQPCRRCVERPARPVGESLQRPVLQLARLLDAAARGEGIGNDGSAECRSQAARESNAEAEQNCSVQKARQIRQDIEQAEHEKRAERGERRPAWRPDTLPKQRKTGEPQPHRETATG